MKNNKKLFSSIVLVIVFCTVGYFVWSKKSNNVNTITQPITQTDTSNWKTHTDTTNGFSFKYPEKLSTSYISTTFIDSWPPIVTVTAGSFSCIPNGPIKGGELLITQKTIDNLAYCVKSQEDGTAGTIYTHYSYETSSNNKLITFNFTLGYPECGNYYGTPNMAECEQEQKSFDLDGLISKIFSTFKFTEPTAQTDTLNWKTYTDSQYGFEIKYPSNWFQSIHGNNLVLAGTKVIGGDSGTISISSGGTPGNIDFKKDCVPVNFAGVSGYSCFTSPDSLYPDKPVIYFTQNNRLFTIYDLIDNEVSHQILSTFKFTSMNSEGQHCGGNIQNAPTCGTGYHCAQIPGSNLPIGDVGGTCVKN